MDLSNLVSSGKIHSLAFSTCGMMGSEVTCMVDFACPDIGALISLFHPGAPTPAKKAREKLAKRFRNSVDVRENPASDEDYVTGWWFPYMEGSANGLLQYLDG